MTNALNAILDDIIQLSKRAGSKIMTIYQTAEFDVTHKDDNTPLTKADVAAHNTIVNGLAKLKVQFPILSEESAKIPYQERAQWQTYWLVDPLDGTREFIKRNGEFTVNIALIADQKPILGVIYAPVIDICYYACKSAGAYKQEGDTTATRLQSRKKQQDITIIAGSRSHRGDSLKRFIANVGKHEIISMGSSLKSCLVAEGKVDIYPRLGPTSEWDTAAAQCIVEESGGLIIDTQGAALKYNTKDSLLNPNFLVVGDPAYDWLPCLDDKI